MQNDHQPSGVVRYIESRRDLTLADKEPEFNAILKRIRRFKPITPQTRVLDIGTGTGWFTILCRRDGINCTGLEVSDRLIEFARQWGRQHRIDPDIRPGDIEDADIGECEYDVVVAYSIFEHVRRWREGISRVFRALKPGGLFYFYSTNKFSFKSGEYPLPLYGWLPNRWRYRLRRWRQGEDIMQWGIDFNQFTIL